MLAIGVKQRDLFFRPKRRRVLQSCLFECGVERPAAGGEVFSLHERAGFAGHEFAVHATVFPLDGKRSLIADAIQPANDFLEVDGAAPGTAKIPSTSTSAII